MTLFPSESCVNRGCEPSLGLALSLSPWAMTLFPWESWQNSSLQGLLWGEQQTPLGAAPGAGFVFSAPQKPTPGFSLLQGCALLLPGAVSPGDNWDLVLPGVILLFSLPWGKLQPQESPPAPREALLCL